MTDQTNRLNYNSGCLDI